MFDRGPHTHLSFLLIRKTQRTHDHVKMPRLQPAALVAAALLLLAACCSAFICPGPKLLQPQQEATAASTSAAVAFAPKQGQRPAGFGGRVHRCVVYTLH